MFQKQGRKRSLCAVFGYSVLCLEMNLMLLLESGPGEMHEQMTIQDQK